MMPASRKDEPRDAVDARSLQGYLEFALSLVDGLRSIVDSGPARKVRRKGDGSPVTELDTAIESALRRRISEVYPRHAVLGEEFGETGDDGRMRWVIDPVDGTEDLIRGVPNYGTLIALECYGEPLVSVVDHPALGLRSWASFGHGAFQNGRRLALGSGAGTGGPVILPAYADFAGNRSGQQRFRTLVEAFPNYRVFRTCYGHSLVFTGAAEAVLEYGVDWWDVAASRLIIEEAGGVFRAWELNGGCDGRKVAVFGRRPVVDSLESVLEGI
jgi:fructose-1,6-bisphosphatase/inositol monophosphatase family enzyme